jgi:hypothetical protein
MPQLDGAREQVSCLKLWLGIAVAIDVSLAGWLVSTLGTADSFRFWIALVAVVLLTSGVLFLHRQIERYIEHVGIL